MRKDRKETIKSNEISEIRKYKLGGYEQKVLIDGKKKSNPIVIFLHGGPGTPIPFCAGCRGMFSDITKKFTMVYWDQLGCGINNYVIDNSFSIDDFACMTADLIKNIKNDFPNNKIILFAVSWGSILAAKASLMVPELIDKVVVYGQFLKELSFNDEVFNVLENSNMKNRDKNELIKIKNKGSEAGVKDLQIISKLIRKYTEGYMAKSVKKLPLGSIIFDLLTSPDYSLKDFIAVIINGYRKNTSLMDELIKIDISDTLKEIKIPYLIIQGETDIVTSTKLIDEYVSKSENKNLHIEIVPRSGHMPGAKVLPLIIDRIESFDGR